MITLTERAASELKDLIKSQDKASSALRVWVAGGGCSGLSYGMALDDPMEGDVLVDYEGIRVVIDQESMRFIEGAEIDYVDDLIGLIRANELRQDLRAMLQLCRTDYSYEPPTSS